MPEWPKVQLKSLCSKITKGTTPTTSGGRFVDTGINFIKSESIGYNGSIDDAKFAFIDVETHEKLKRSQLVAGDILYSIAGVHLGKSASARPEHLPANTNQAVAIIRVEENKANRKFIEYVLRNRSFVEQVLGGVAQSAQPNVNLTEIGQFLVPLPPRPQQEKVAGILTALDDKIELNRRMNKTLEAMARAIFKDWFVDFGPTRAKAEGRAPYLAPEIWDLFPGALDEEDKPFGWMLHPASDLFEFNPRESVKKGTNAPYLDMAALPTLGAVADVPIRREYKSGSKFRDGDTLFARITPCLENGKTAYVFDLGKGVVGGGSTEFIVIRSRAPLPKLVSYILARDPEFRAHAERSMTGTSGRQRANYEALSRYELAGPADDRLWRALGDVVNPLMDRVIANARETRTLAQTRDFLLPKLMSGEIRLREAMKVVEAVA